VWLGVAFTLSGFLLWRPASCIDEPVRDLERISTLHNDLHVLAGSDTGRRSIAVNRNAKRDVDLPDS
jgi:hypothetical protein